MSPWLRVLILMTLLVTTACSGTARRPAAPPAPTAHARDAVVDGRRLQYALHLAEQPNLVYQLDCVTGVALCAQAIYRELWATFHLDAADEAALAAWKTHRTRHGGEFRRIDGVRPPQPLLAPAGVFDLAERQRIAGLSARTPDAFQQSMGLLSSDADARELRAVMARFEPRFGAWWRQRGFAAGSVFFDGFRKLLTDPFLDSTFEKAIRFYEADLPAGTTFQIHLVVQPRSSRKLQVAYQLESDAVIEAPEGGNPRDFIDIVAHEFFHHLFFRMNPQRQAALLERVCASDDPFSAASFGMFDEAVAASLGNGVVGAHYRAPDAFAKQLARGFVHYKAAGSVAQRLYPSMGAYLDNGVAVSSNEFLQAFNDAARASYEGGRPRPIDYLHSPVSIAEPRFASAAQRLRDAAWAGFPTLREYASFDAEARTFLVKHPVMSAAIFLPNDTDVASAVEPLLDGAIRKHTARIASLTKQSRGFVYALPRHAKSYTFLFVAADAATMGQLVDGFVALPARGEGPLVELPK